MSGPYEDYLVLISILGTRSEFEKEFKISISDNIESSSIREDFFTETIRQH